MYEVTKTDEFESWVTGLKDVVGKAKILSRIRRLEMGDPGDVAPVGDGISELRIPNGLATASPTSGPTRRSS